MPLAADISLQNFATSFAKSMVKSVTVRSQVTPDFTYDPWAPTPEQPPGGGGSWLMEIIKPEITIEGGEQPIVIAPYGTPTENYMPHALFGSAAALVGVVMLIIWIARATKK